MGNNLNFDYFYEKAAKLTAEAEARRKQADEICHAISVLAEVASNDNDTGNVPLAVASIVAADVAHVVPIVEAANDNAALASPPPPPPPSIAAAATRKGGRSKLADTDLIDALTTRTQTPAEMAERLAKMGITVSKSLIYQRMPKLAEALPDLIVAEGKAWRIKSKAAADTSAKVVKTAASAAAPRKGKAGKAKAVTVSTKPPAPTVKPKVFARKRKATPKKSSHNPFASCAKLMASLLTNEWKSVATLVDQARSYGWNGPSDLAARALDGLVRSGLANCRSTGGPVSYCGA